ncbi:MAG: polysaccharide deacetylase family protein [Planctomycetota bacterium]
MNSVRVVLTATLSLLASAMCADTPRPLLPIPDKLVVLTFDDGNASDFTTVAPILESHGFCGTFFVTSGWVGRDKRVTWKQVANLQQRGFEIACDTNSHPNLLRLSDDKIQAEIEAFDRACAKHGIRKATSFAYPGAHFDRRMLKVLAKLGYTRARRGRDPERPCEDEGGPGRAYVPGEDDPFVIPTALTRGIGALSDQLIEEALGKSSGGRVTVLTYHGVPDVHRHCSISVERFRRDMKFLKKSGATVIALRDLDRYVDLSKRPKDPFASIVARLGLEVRNARCDAGKSKQSFTWDLDTKRWTQKQVAYRILVASRREILDGDRGDLWDSGKVKSANRSRVRYVGKALKPGATYWWKVQCWNRRDAAEIEKVVPYVCKELVDELKKSRAGKFSSAASFELEGSR